MSESDSDDDEKEEDGDKKNKSDINKKGEDDSKATSDTTASLIATIPSPAKNRFQQATVTQPTPSQPQEPPLLIYDAEGTHLFTSPECFAEAKKKGICGRKRDYYSLGCVLYCLAFGMTPFNPGLLQKNTAIFLQLEIQQCNIHFPGWLEMSVGEAREREAREKNGGNDDSNKMMIEDGGGSSSSASSGGGNSSGNSIAQDTVELVTLMQSLLRKDPGERVVEACWGN